MSRTLIIVESPTKAKTISKFLGKNYKVQSSMGHVIDLPKSQLGVNIENNFTPKYITIRGKGEILKKLRDAKKKSSKVLLALDPDREGEAIAWHLQRALKIPEDSSCRVEFNEITKPAVKEGVKNPRSINFNRVNAQQARRILDRLVGYKLSPLLWRKVKKGLSAGRVQSVTLKLICDRENEIDNFEPQEYWSLTVYLKTESLESFVEAKLTKINNKKADIKSKGEVEGIINDLQKKLFVLENVKKRQKRKNPLPPFITSTLQQEAYQKLNFTAQKTMRTAQQLYEGIELGKEGNVGLITYMRTDSTKVAGTAQQEAISYIKEAYGEEYAVSKPRSFVSRKKAQEAHEAVRPTSVLKTPDYVKKHLTKDQFSLYKLIWERFVASQMEAAFYNITTFIIKSGGYEFRANGSTVNFLGFLKVYNLNEKEKEKILPALDEGSKFLVEKFEPKQHFTQPPPRYSEATLVKMLEQLGIGRPSTYAPIVSTILSRGYVVREDKQFKPTELGYLVNELLSNYFDNIMDVKFTAHLEDKLDKIDSGELDWVQIIEEFYESFKKDLQKAEKEIGEIEIKEEVTEEKCEKCENYMVIKHGKFGKFMACPKFPDCKNAKPLLESIGVECPKCNGEIVVRRSKKRRIFYGCSNYPDCDFVSNKKPVNKKCPECKNVLVMDISKKQEKLVCSNNQCANEGKIEDIKAGE